MDALDETADGSVRSVRWPPAGVRLTTPRLVLRLPDEHELKQLAGVAAEGVHEPTVQPFGVPWGTQPPRLRARSVLQWHWQTRGCWTADRWTFDFAVFYEGEPIGVQGLSAVGFPIRREVATGSWLGLRYQRQGYGTEIRAAVLVLAFDALGARTAVTGAYEDNLAAMKVNTALGYHDNGVEVANRDGTRVLARRFRLTAETADMGHWPTVTVDGVDDEVLGLCGARDPTGHQALPLGGYPHE